MPTTYEAIATVTVGSGGASSISFSSIPSTYTDLQVLMSIRCSDVGTPGLFLQFNSSSSNNSHRYLLGDGSSASSGTNSYGIGTTAIYVGTTNDVGNTANTFSSHSIYIPNYAGSTNKSVGAEFVQENNATTAYSGLVAGLWSNTSAITSLYFYLYNSGTFGQYTTATLYGIKNS